MNHARLRAMPYYKVVVKVKKLKRVKTQTSVLFSKHDRETKTPIVPPVPTRTAAHATGAAVLRAANHQTVTAIGSVLLKQIGRSPFGCVCLAVFRPLFGHLPV